MILGWRSGQDQQRHTGEHQRREHLAGLLWPDSTDERGRALVRCAILGGMLDRRGPELLREGLELHINSGDKYGIAQGLELGACMPGDPDLAARLLGAAAAMRRKMGAPIPPVEQTEIAFHTDALRAQLGAGFDAAWHDCATRADEMPRRLMTSL